MYISNPTVETLSNCVSYVQICVIDSNRFKIINHTLSSAETYATNDPVVVLVCSKKGRRKLCRKLYYY